MHMTWQVLVDSFKYFFRQFLPLHPTSITFTFLNFSSLLPPHSLSLPLALFSLVMFSLVKLAVMFTAAISVAAMPSNMARNPQHHREIAARVAQPEPVPAPEVEARDMAVPAKRFTRKRRASTGRCKPNNSSNTPSSAVKDEPVPSSEPAPSKTPVVEIKPTSTPPKENPEPTPTTTNKPEPTPTPTPTPTPGSGSGGGGGQVYTGQGT